MNRWLKYGVVLTGFLIPAALFFMFEKGGQDFVYRLVPGVLLWYLLELMDIKQAMDVRLIVGKRVGKHDVSAIAKGINQSLEKLSDGHGPDSLFLECAYIAIEKFGNNIEQASRGVLRLTDDEVLGTLPVDLAEQVKRTLDATLIWSEDDLRSDFGKEYADALQRAISERGVKVRRLFIFDNINNVPDEAMLRMQTEMGSGIRIKMIASDGWGGGDGRPIDFGIWDEALVWEYRAVQRGRRRTAYLKRGETNVNTFKSLFTANWRSGRTPQRATTSGEVGYHI